LVTVSHLALLGTNWPLGYKKWPNVQNMTESGLGWGLRLGVTRPKMTQNAPKQLKHAGVLQNCGGKKELKCS
jgi:hypothetical protein